MVDQTQIISDMSRVSFNIPSSVYRAVGRTIAAFSYLESTAELMIWDFLGVKPDAGRIFTKNMAANRKLSVLKELITLRDNAEVSVHLNKDFWTLAEEAAIERNAIAHGTWIWADGSRPMIVSLRWKEKSLPNSITAEHFPITRMKKLELTSYVLDGALRKASAVLGLRQPQYERPKPESSESLTISHPLHQA